MRVVATDAFESIGSALRDLPAAYALLHHAKHLLSMGIGRLCDKANALQVGLAAYFDEDVQIDGNLTTIGDFKCAVMQTAAATDLGAAAEKIAVLDGDGTVRYRTPAELLADLGADYIVEQGKSGVWTYRKWASGVAECWGQPSKSVASSGTFLGANAYSTDFALPSGLFVSVDSANANPILGSNYAIPAFIKTTPTSVGVDALSNESGTKDFSANIFVRGRWK